MKKKKTPPVLQLDDIADYKVAATADHIAERHHSRSRAYLEMGKLIYHLENRAGMRKSQTIYGLLKSRGVPEGSVNNGRLAANFILTFVATGLISEARADDILTSRIARQTDRLMKGKVESSLKMTTDDLAAVIGEGEPAALGDELDCLAEHGMTIADKEEHDRQAEDERRRMEAAAKAAAEAEPAEPEAEPTPDPAEEETSEPEGTPEPSADPVEEPEPTANPEPTADPVEEEATAEPAAEPETEAEAAPTPAPTPEGHSLADVLEMIDEAQLASFDLDPSDLVSLKDRVAEWVDQIDESLAAVNPEAIAA